MNEYMPEGSLITTKRNYDLTSTYEGLEKALRLGAIVEAHAVVCDHNLNLEVEFPSGIKGIIPKNEVILRGETKDIAILTRVGKPVAFKVTGFTEDSYGKAVAILSRKAAQIECEENFIKNLLPGDIVYSKITHLESFGAFVDIGCGIISLLSIDSISVSRISHPSERFSVGDYVYTAVRGIDERGRIFVSMRELLGTWEENAALFREGQTVRGIVRSVESYGIFVELTPNLAGLAEYKEGISENRYAAVYIKSIIPEKMKVKLILIDIAEPSKTKAPLYYHVDPNTVCHIDKWVYSPKSSKRIIETIF